MALDDYSDLFSQAEQKYNLPAGLLYAQAQNEDSSGDPNAKGQSTKYGTAQGVMQLLPDTAKSLGVDPTDPAQAIDGAGKLMRENLDRYKDLPTALKAYHGGTNSSNWGDKTNTYSQKVQKSMGITIAPVPEAGDDTLEMLKTSTSSTPTSTIKAGDDTLELLNSKSTTPPPPATPPVSTGEDLTRSYASGAANVVKNLPNVPSATLDFLTKSPAYINALANGQTNEQAIATANSLTGTKPFTIDGKPILDSNGKPLTIGTGLNSPINTDLRKLGTMGSNALSAVGTAAAPYLARGVNAFDNMIGQGNPNLTAQDINETASAKDAPASVASYQPQTDVGSEIKSGVQTAGTGAVLRFGPIASLVGNALMQKASEMSGGNPLAELGAGAIGAKMGGKAENYIGDSITAGVNPLSPSSVARGAIDKVIGNRVSPENTDLTSPIPGVKRTLAEATGNKDLAAEELALRKQNPDAFPTEQNQQARADYLQGITKTPQDIAIAKEAIDQEALPLKAQAFENKVPTDATPVLDTMQQILASPSGKNKAVRDAFAEVEKNLYKTNPLTDKDGSPLLDSSGKPLKFLETDPAQLEGVRESINKSLSTQAAMSGNTAGLAAKELMQVRDVLDNVIEKGAPGYANYRKTYSEMSKPVDEMQFLQNSGLTDSTGEVNPASLNSKKIDSVLQNINKGQAAKGLNPAKNVSSDIVTKLQNLRDDLRVSESISQGKGRTPPISVKPPSIFSNVVGYGVPTAIASTHPIAAAAMGIGKVAMDIRKSKINDALLDRFANPEKYPNALQRAGK